MHHPALKAVALTAAAATTIAAGYVLWDTTARDPGQFVPVTMVAVADTVHPGETLGIVARRHGIDPAPLAAALRPLDPVPITLAPGTDVLLKTGVGDSVVGEISFRRSRTERVILRRDRTGWSADLVPIGWHSERVIVGGSLDDSLGLAIDSALTGPALNPANRADLLARLADVFAWKVDFAREVAPGDRFRAIVDLDVSNEGHQELGTIRAVELTLSGHRLEAFWFQPLRGPAGYFDGEGRSLRRQFLRAPLEFRRISSTFATMRLHPILATIRAHRGVDYAAPAGTPVAAAGAGVVTIAGPSGQYGIMVEIDHGHGVTTRYGHLSRLGPGVRVGRAVPQGTLIGYVGQTGLATAPHLHYEFRVNSVPRDLRWLDVDPGPPISPALLNNFLAERDQLRSLLRPATLSTAP